MSIERQPVADTQRVSADKPATLTDPANLRNEAPSEANSETVLSGQQNVSPQQQAQNNAPPETRAQRKARYASVLSRSLVDDRLNVPLPPHLYGEWIRNDPLEINRMQMLGFWLDTEYAPRRAIHQGAKESAVMGDVVFVVCERVNKEAIDEVRHEQFLKLNAPKASREEKDFRKTTSANLGSDIPTFSESRATEANRDDIAAALGFNRQE